MNLAELKDALFLACSTSKIFECTNRRNLKSQGFAFIKVRAYIVIQQELAFLLDLDKVTV